MTDLPWDQLAEARGLGSVPPPRRLGELPHLFRLPGRGLLVKRHWFLTPERAAAVSAAMAALSAAGLGPTLLDPVFTWIDGTAYSVMEELALVPWTTARAAEAAAALARAHRLMAPLPAPAGPMAAPPERILAETAAIAGPDWGDLLDEAAALRTALPVQLAHNDLHPGNVLATAGEVRLADFDSAGASPRVLDVFFAALRLTDRSPAAMVAFVGAYAERAPLTAQEWRAGPTLLVADLIGKLAFILRREAAGDSRFVKDLQPYRDHLAAALRLREGL